MSQLEQIIREVRALLKDQKRLVLDLAKIAQDLKAKAAEVKSITRFSRHLAAHELVSALQDAEPPVRAAGEHVIKAGTATAAWLAARPATTTSHDPGRGPLHAHVGAPPRDTGTQPGPDALQELDDVVDGLNSYPLVITDPWSEAETQASASDPCDRPTLHNPSTEDVEWDGLNGTAFALFAMAITAYGRVKRFREDR